MKAHGTNQEMLEEGCHQLLIEHDYGEGLNSYGAERAACANQTTISPTMYLI